jgi:hypothetical protein
MTRQASKLSEKLFDESYPLVYLVQEIAALERQLEIYKFAFNHICDELEDENNPWPYDLKEHYLKEAEYHVTRSTGG